MDGLVRTIGKAPSELDWKDWLKRLRTERRRVSEELGNFRERINGERKERSKKKAKSKGTKFTKEQVDELRERVRKLGLGQKEIAEAFGEEVANLLIGKE